MQTKTAENSSLAVGQEAHGYTLHDGLEVLYPSSSDESLRSAHVSPPSETRPELLVHQHGETHTAIAGLFRVVERENRHNYKVVPKVLQPLLVEGEIRIAAYPAPPEFESILSR